MQEKKTQHADLHSGLQSNRLTKEKADVQKKMDFMSRLVKTVYYCIITIVCLSVSDCLRLYACNLGNETCMPSIFIYCAITLLAPKYKFLMEWPQKSG